MKREDGLGVPWGKSVSGVDGTTGLLKEVSGHPPTRHTQTPELFTSQKFRFSR
jgi:hypothetical protein